MRSGFFNVYLDEETRFAYSVFRVKLTIFSPGGDLPAMIPLGSF